jgi:two-component system cell cycle response regulator DivK
MQSSNSKGLPPVVLVVDDTNDNLVLISLAVQEMNCRVVTAVNGRDALAVALLAGPQLILMDIAMPVLDGIGATRLIRRQETLKDVPVVILSAFDTESFRQQAIDAGVNGYFTKPIDFDRLRQFIEKLLSGKPSVDVAGEAISPDTGRLDPRFMLWRLFCAENNVSVETLPSELGRELKKEWEQLKKNNKKRLFKL